MFRFWSIAARFRRRRPRRLARRASVASFNHDGLEVARVRRGRAWLPFWHIAGFVYISLLIRLIVIAQIGPESYAHRMENMKQGTFLERVGAVIMHMDPVSQAIANDVRVSLRNLGLM